MATQFCVLVLVADTLLTDKVYDADEQVIMLEIFYRCSYVKL